MDFKFIDKKYRPVPFWSWNEKLETEEQYQWAINRIEELRPLINIDTPCYDHNSVEKELLSFLIMDYEEEHSEEDQ